MKKHKAQFKSQYQVVEYVGIAVDEQYRLQKKSNLNNRHPLIDWGWTEKQALEYCYSKGFNFDGLYELFNRVSCWCCPLQPLSALKQLRKHFPELWSRLRELDLKTQTPFRVDYTVEDLEIRFQLEDELQENGEDVNYRTKDFRMRLKERLQAKKEA